MSHPYLSFSDSSTYSGFLVVGTSKSTGWGNGLTNSSVKIVEIPSTFEGKTIAEVGYLAFGFTGIESIFIPKTIKMLGNGAFYGCSSLKEVRFEKGNKLEKMDENVFASCSSLTRIDIPQTLKTVISSTGERIFKGNTALECFSYFGSSNFTSEFIFSDSNDNVIVHVSKDYPYDTLGQKSTTRDDMTCGVSNEHFYIDSISKTCSAFRANNCARPRKIETFLMLKCF